jgi:RNA polymerase sigma factor (sigma-70 family)
MGYEEDAVGLLGAKEFLDKLYGFAYRRCNSAHEAEDLCSEIIVSALASLRRQPRIENFHAFIWTVAHRVYADYCEKRQRNAALYSVSGYSDEAVSVTVNPIEDFLEREENSARLRAIMREISFLSAIYREVMVLYYLDGLKTTQIAEKLGISETTVKQRLFSARSTIKKEAEKMDTNLAIEPVHIDFIGNGNPVGNDPREKAERVLSQNLVYLCRNTALTAKEISEKLGVPMLFIEDEIRIQLKGLNGEYGLLRQLENGKYISNVLILDKAELEAGISV